MSIEITCPVIRSPNEVSGAMDQISNTVSDFNVSEREHPPRNSLGILYVSHIVSPSFNVTVSFSYSFLPILETVFRLTFFFFSLDPNAALRSR